ncbi:tautomerase family protein [Halpernia frigidisoli]|uniref:Tautomerase enzyme n=1 Tax=Halpernia frigidisoli TaxID=1125876 RepID=A0A1I3FJ84_9FLAO|nr:tautomerase family protein [Halpernia frigidisoli]SFI11318.1 Tautomerase enzyme [Halpernia frigidisoli]
MPLIRIDLVEGRSQDEIKILLDTINDCVEQSFETPDRDRYQLVTQHKQNEMVFLDTGLGFERSKNLVVIQVFTSPRDVKMKQKFYKLMSEKLNQKCGLDGKDLFISIMTNNKEDWSFGHGDAQYITGEL